MINQVQVGLGGDHGQVVLEPVMEGPDAECEHVKEAPLVKEATYRHNSATQGTVEVGVAKMTSPIKYFIHKE